MADVGVSHDVKHRYFPENVDRIPQCKVWVYAMFLTIWYVNGMVIFVVFYVILLFLLQYIWPNSIPVTTYKFLCSVSRLV
jgi:hypothetical protein